MAAALQAARVPVRVVPELERALVQAPARVQRAPRPGLRVPRELPQARPVPRRARPREPAQVPPVPQRVLARALALVQAAPESGRAPVWARVLAASAPVSARALA